jgi:hypothetical protein
LNVRGNTVLLSPLILTTPSLFVLVTLIEINQAGITNGVVPVTTKFSWILCVGASKQAPSVITGPVGVYVAQLASVS